MKIALIGYGAMGKLVAAEAKKAGDDIGLIVRSDELNTTASDLATRLRVVAGPVGRKDLDDAIRRPRA